jgi:hypothetical protein
MRFGAARKSRPDSYPALASVRGDVAVTPAGQAALRSPAASRGTIETRTEREKPLQ